MAFLAGCGAGPATLESSATHVPWFEVGSNELAVQAKPRRYAGELVTTGLSGCSQTTVSTGNRAVVVLDLAAGGAVTGCRRRNVHRVYASNEDHGAASEEQATREQQGMSGRWRPVGDMLEVELGLDDAECAPSFAGNPGAGSGPRPWRLQCNRIGAGDLQRLFAAELAPESEGGKELIACRFADEPPFEVYDGFTLRAQGQPGEWIILASPGVRLEEHVHDFSGSDLRASFPSAPITVAWEGR
jgi:hypothetical protein